MSTYNSQLQSNNTDLQQVLQALQTKAAGGEQATPVISIDSTNGLITATAGTKSSTHQLAFQPAKTIIPGTSSQVAVSSGYFTGGDVTVAGDANLVASNIKNGISIFGVSGTLQESNGNGESTDSEYYTSGIIELSHLTHEITIPVSGQIGGLSLTYLGSAISTYSIEGVVRSLYCISSSYEKGYITNESILYTDFTYDTESGLVSLSEESNFFESGIYVYVVW